MIEISYQLCFYADCLIAESCIFLFGDRKLCAIGKRELEPAYIGDIVGIDEIALVTAQKELRYLFLQIIQLSREEILDILS